MKKRLKILILPVLAVFLTGGAAADSSIRIVSVNACTDEWLLQTASPGSIRGVTRLNHSDISEQILRKNPQIVRLPSSVEAILKMQPSVVLSGLFSNPLLTGQLKRLNVPVISLDVPRNWAEVKQVLEKVAEISHVENAGSRLESRLAGLESLRQDSKLYGRRAVFWSPGGHLSGRGTFEDEFIKTLGMVNAAEHANYRFISIEELIELKPSVILVTQNSAVKDSWSYDTLFHPALRAALPPAEYLFVPEEAVSCASEYSIEIAEKILKESA